MLYRPHPVSTIATSTQSLDPTLQSVATTSLHAALNRTDASRGGVVVIDAHSGAIKAMVNANRQGYAHHAENIIIDAPWEPGSVIKPLTIAAALNEGAIGLNTTFYDTGDTFVDGYRITNAVMTQSRTITVQNIVTDSINTGTVNVLRRLGDGKNINMRARQTLYHYFTDQYRFGNNGVPGVTTGVIPSPTVGDKLELTYANMAFGQDMTITPLQLVSAYAAVLNGGTYFQPQLGDKVSRILGKNIVSQQTSAQIRQLLQNALATNNTKAQRNGYTMGGKSGTAHVATLSGTYYNNHRDDGTYIGYIADTTSMYVMLVRLDEPETPEHTFASTLAKQAWTNIVTTKIDTTGSFVN